MKHVAGFLVARSLARHIIEFYKNLFFILIGCRVRERERDLQASLFRTAICFTHILHTVLF